MYEQSTFILQSGFSFWNVQYVANHMSWLLWTLFQTICKWKTCWKLDKSLWMMVCTSAKYLIIYGTIPVSWSHFCLHFFAFSSVEIWINDCKLYFRQSFSFWNSVSIFAAIFSVLNCRYCTRIFFAMIIFIICSWIMYSIEYLSKMLTSF